MVEIPVTRARAELADLLNRVVYGAERVVLTRHGRAIAALVSAADLERLEASEQPHAHGGQDAQRRDNVALISSVAPAHPPLDSPAAAPREIPTPLAPAAEWPQVTSPPPEKLGGETGMSG